MLFIYFFCKIGVGLINIYIYTINRIVEVKVLLGHSSLLEKIINPGKYNSKTNSGKKNINYDSIQSKCIKYK